jgi:hypothetical protein
MNTSRKALVRFA